jgi:hypothetical protein
VAASRHSLQCMENWPQPWRPRRGGPSNFPAHPRTSVLPCPAAFVLAYPTAPRALLPHRAGTGGLDLLHNAALVEAAEAREAAEAARTVKYVDLSKMDEVYDRVRDWQETGKKKFK